MINGRSNGTSHGAALDPASQAIRTPSQPQSPADYLTEVVASWPPAMDTGTAPSAQPASTPAGMSRALQSAPAGAPSARRVALGTHGGLMDPADLYGDGETQHLAAELSELLHTYPPRGATTSRLPHPSTLLPPSAAAGYAPAVRPLNDYAADDEELQLPYAWRHDPPPPEPWIKRQLRFVAIGCLTGMAIVVPAVLMMTGSLNVSAIGGLQQASLGASDRPGDRPGDRSGDRSGDGGNPSGARGASHLAEARPLPLPPKALPRPEPEPPTAAAPTPTTTVADIKARSVTTTEVFPVRAAPPPPIDLNAILVAEGQNLLQAGRISEARGPLSKAASSGSAAAMLTLAETFDPNMLAAWGAPRDVKPDVSTARLFYGRALAAGESSAQKRLDMLR